MMNFYEFAFQMEKDGEQFYRDLAAGAANKGFGTIFNLLADDEVAHQKIFSCLQSDLPLTKNTADPIASQNVFAQLKKENAMADLDSSQLHLYQKALDVEKKSQELYLQEAAKVTEPEVKKILEQLAAEEEQHYFLLHNIVELMLHPQNWVENGEFYHNEVY